MELMPLLVPAPVPVPASVPALALLFAVVPMLVSVSALRMLSEAQFLHIRGKRGVGCLTIDVHLGCSGVSR